jgi:hypothetical protein
MVVGSHAAFGTAGLIIIHHDQKPFSISIYYFLLSIFSGAAAFPAAALFICSV